MTTRPGWRGKTYVALALSLAAVAYCLGADDPPNPFGGVQKERSDAVFGAICLSDGTFVRGKVYLTRGHELRIYDAAKEQNRDVPLKAVREIRCLVEKEWIEAEWRFKENANDEKVLTGRKYPARSYVHEVVLARGGSIKGPLSAVVYIEPEAENPERETEEKQDAEQSRALKPARYLLHRRDKGEPGKTLRDLVYVQKIIVGDEARKLSKPGATEDKSKSAGEKR